MQEESRDEPVVPLSRRDDLVEQARHSALLEGLLVSKEFVADSESYAAGEISSDELVRLTRERFGLVGNA